MNIARAANRVAFLLMVFGLVALVACQQTTPGPAGPAGPAGPKGDTGEPGAAGPAPLTAKGGGDPYNIVFNGTGDATTTIGALTAPDGGELNLRDAFSGGAEPLKYEITTPSLTDGAFEAGAFKISLSESGMLTVEKKSATATTYGAADFTTGATFTVKATDTNDVEATRSVNIKANRAPRLVDGIAYEVPDSGAPERDVDQANEQRVKFMVGTQAELKLGTVTKQAWNKIHLTGTRNVLEGATGNLFDDDEDDGELTLTIKTIDEDHVMAEVADDGDITITGVKSTWNGAATDAKHVPTQIVVTATDSGGLGKDATLFVWVDGAPAVDPDGVIQATYPVRMSDSPRRVVNVLGNFFADPEGFDMTVDPVDTDVASSRTSCATAVIQNDGSTPATAAVEVTVHNAPCMATITVLGKVAGYDVNSPARRTPGTWSIQAVDRDGDDAGAINADDYGDNNNTGHGEYPPSQFVALTFDVTTIP